MSIEFSCPRCGRRHQGPDHLAGKQARCGCGNVLSVPAAAVAAPAPQFVSAGMQAYEEARRAQAERQREESANLPGSVRMVLGGTLAAGVASLLGTMLFLLVTLAAAAGDRPEELIKMVILFLIWGLLTALNFTEAGLVYARNFAARPLGYVVAVLNLCGGPIHIGCAILCFIGLGRADFQQHLDGRRR